MGVPELQAVIMMSTNDLQFRVVKVQETAEKHEGQQANCLKCEPLPMPRSVHEAFSP